MRVPGGGGVRSGGFPRTSHPLHVRIGAGNPIHGFVQCEALRAVDLDARERDGRAEVVGSVDDETLAQVLACVKVVAGLD